MCKSNTTNFSTSAGLDSAERVEVEVKRFLGSGTTEAACFDFPQTSIVDPPPLIIALDTPPSIKHYGSS